jgi:hypothetical protein
MQLPLSPPEPVLTNLSYPQLHESGLECVRLTHAPVIPASGKNPSTVRPAVPISVCRQAIRSIGAEHFSLSSDFGQTGDPPPPEGMRAFVSAVAADGGSERELDLMARTNPAHLLCLER